MNRIVLLIPCLQMGGTEIATLETAKALLQHGFIPEVIVYFDEIDSSVLNTFLAANIKVCNLKVSRSNRFFGKLELFFRLKRKLKAQINDLIWVQYMTPTLLPLLVARFFTPKLVAAVHVAAGHYDVGGLRRMRWLARELCDCFVCVSNTTALGIFGEIHKGSTYINRVHVLPNSIDMVAVNSVTRFNWRAALDLPAESLLIGYVGRLTKNKGVDILIQAAARLIIDFPHLHWIIVGGGPDRQDLECLVASLNLSSVVSFVGVAPRDAVYSAFKGFDIAVAPSREEGFGLTALEAMASGVPLVASRVDALSEVVLDGATGLLFEPENADDLAQSLQKLIKNPALREELSSAGVTHATRTYDKPIFQRRVSNMLQRLSFL